MTTLDRALDEALATKWHGRRCAKRNRSQTQIAISTLHDVAGHDTHVEDVTLRNLKDAVQAWLRHGTQASTINARLNCLSAIGVSVNGSRLPLPRKLKWFLTDEAARAIVPQLRAHGVTNRWHRFYPALADLIEWTVLVGTRVEETLRLRWSDLTLDERDGRLSGRVRVPGSKTSSAQKTLPLGDQAAALVHRMAAERLARGPDDVRDQSLLIGIDYNAAQRSWMLARLLLEDLPDPSVATLKAFRRSAARNLHAVKGMPLDMVRQYLRHEKVETTMGYLRLTGGYDEEEMRRWL